MQWLIVTDLDGTLLDDTYPHAAAARVLNEIQSNHADVQVALASSKTLIEMLGLACTVDPLPYLIFENGGGAAWPSGRFLRRGERQAGAYEVTTFARGYEHVRQVLNTARRRKGYRFRGFSDLTSRDIATLTGLSPLGADLARVRLTSEPLLWEDDPAALQAFATELEAAGLALQRGGRFYHVTSGGTKAEAIEFLREMVRYELGSIPRVLACGDAPNDLDMLELADHALIFPDRNGTYLRADRAQISHAPRSGPECWLAGVQGIVTPGAGALNEQM